MALTAAENPFDVTVEQVHALVHYARLFGPGEAVPPGTKGTSPETVEGWIRDLSGILAGRLEQNRQYWQDRPERAERVAGLGRAAVANGTAYYWQSSLYPERSGVNDTSYAADLRSRWEEGQASLLALIDLWAGQGDTGHGPGGADGLPNGITGLFPAPQFPDHFGV